MMSQPAALWWQGEDRSKGPTMDCMIESSSSSVINIVTASIVQTEKMVPEFRHPSMQSNGPAKAIFTWTLESWQGHFQTCPQRTYIHALEGQAGSWSIEFYWWYFPISCSAFKHHKLYTVLKGRPESPHTHQLLMDVLALICHALMEGHLFYRSSHTLKSRVPIPCCI